MLIKLIYETQALAAIKKEIAQLETNQLYFLERFIIKEKNLRKEAVFKEWQLFLADQVEHYVIK